MPKLSWFDIKNFERPDNSYPDYDEYFGREEDRPLYADDHIEDEYMEDDDEPIL